MSMNTMDFHIERVLWTSTEISDRVSELATDITKDLSTSAYSSSPAIFVGVVTGAFLFFADLIRGIPLPVSVDFLRVESYGSFTRSSGSPLISLQLKLEVASRHVVVVEDIVDTGRTLSCIVEYLKRKGASSVSVCSFLDKPARREVPLELIGEGKYYRGFECPDVFVVGYGMDFAEKYRNLPYIGVLKPEFYASLNDSPSQTVE